MRIAMAGFVICLLCICGCKVQQQAATTSTTPAVTGKTVALTITDGAGKAVLAINGSGEKYTVTAKGTDAGKLKLKDGKIKFYDAAGTQVGAVKLKDGDYSLRDASDAKIGKFAPKEGGYRLKDAAGIILLKIKPKDGGFKVSDGSDMQLARGKRKGEKLTLEAENGTVLYIVTGSPTPDAVGLVAAKNLSPLQKAALMLAPELLK